MHHTKCELNALINYIEDTGERTKILMEPTSHCQYPVLKALQDAGFPVCLINPYQMKKYGDTVFCYYSSNDLSTALAQEQCVDLVSLSPKSADSIILQMQNIAETIPDYKVLRAMHGVGDRLGPVILAEVGDIRRFHSGKALNAYAGNDAPPYQSGQFESRNRHISKRGNPALRKACFEVMQALKLIRPQDDPVSLFLLKKE